jgi:adenylate kinase
LERRKDSDWFLWSFAPFVDGVLGMLLVFIGPPGAGKGTQSVRLCENFKIPHLSTGNILRNAKAAGSELGRIVGPIMDAGGLVSDELMIEVVADRLAQSDCRNGFLLDGFPRSIPQAHSLDNMLASRKQRLAAVIELHVPIAELQRRLINRFFELDDPRPEDQPDAIPNRLKLYEQITRPLIEYYSTKKILVKVNGLGSPDEVFHRIETGIKNL